MATQYYDFYGKARYAKVYEPDEYMGAKKYKIGIYPDKASLARFKKSGIQKTLREDENGQFFEADRAQTRLFGDKLVKFTPPIIYDKNGEVLISYRNDNDNLVRSYEPAKEEEPHRKGSMILIGNGSEIEITVAVFDTLKGKGQRLESVKIIDLIEYKKPEPVVEEELDDDIPFEEPKKEVPVKKPKGKAPW